MDYGLVGYWGFEESSGQTAYDASLYSNDGILGGSTSAESGDPKWTTGIKPLSGGVSGGGALQFDGVDDYVEVADDSSLNLTDAITVEAWIKPVSVVGTHSLFIDKDYSSAWALNFNVGDRIKYYMVTSVNNEIVGAAGTITLNKWHHVVMTYDSSSGAWVSYINGVQDIDETLSGSISTSTQNLIFGRDSAGIYPFDGLIDEVRIYNRALSAEEIRYHYNRGGPVAHWRFDEGEGQTAFDESVNDNDGTLGSTTASDAGDPTWVQGKYGSALSFDGVDDYVEITSSTGLDYQDSDYFTVETWLYWNGGGHIRQYVWDNRDAPGPGYYLLLGDKVDATTLTIKAIGSISAGDAIASTNISSGQWYHIVGVFDKINDKITLYVDGIQKDQQDWADSGSDSTGKKFIGKAYVNVTTNYQWNGLIDDVRIYNYARSPKQILQDYNAGLGTYFK
jgi:hypothetical protein